MVTPLEIQKHEFSTKWRGYEKEEVKHFLYAISEEFENLLEQSHQTGKELAVLRERLNDMASRDKVLKDTLITAQQIKSEVQENAHKEAELIVKEACLKADSIFEDAKEKVDQVRHQMVELRRLRNDLLAETEMMVSRFSHFVEAEAQIALESDKLHNFMSRKNQLRLKPETQPGSRPIGKSGAPMGPGKKANTGT